MLVYAVRPRNAQVLGRALTNGRIAHDVCGDLAALQHRLTSIGQDLGALVVTERSLSSRARAAVHAFQDVEPVWSELPIVLLSPRDRAPEQTRQLRNVILVRQPSSPRQFLSVVQIALETRSHQFDVQNLLLQLEEQRDWLEQALMRLQRHGLHDSGKSRELARKLAVSRRRLTQRREEDRLMLARELHDTVIQRLLYLSMRLSPGEAVARESGLPELRQTIEEARLDAHAAVKDLRRLIRELRPAGLEMGFAAALQPTVARLAPRTQVRLDVEGIREFPNDVTLCLYRAAQEALRNVERHAEATQVRVVVRRYGNSAHLLVADNGKGFEVPAQLDHFAHQEHFGLMGVEEFVSGLGGDVRIRSAIGKGTCVRARVPVEASVVG